MTPSVKPLWQVLLLVFLFVLLLAAVKIAISLPPLDRPSYWIDAEKMLAGVVSLSTNEPNGLNLNLNTGILEYANRPGFSVWASDRQGRWRLLGCPRKDQPGIIDWELIVPQPDGAERKTRFEFPVQPTVLDENTIIGSTDYELHVLDLRTSELKSQSINSQLRAQQLRAMTHRQPRHYLQVLSVTASSPTAQSSFSASLYLLNAENEAVLIWNKPIYHADAYQIIGDSIYLICPSQKSIDRYQFDTGELTESTRIPADIVKLLEESLTAKIFVNDLPVPIMRVEEIDGVEKTRFWKIPELEPVRLPHDEIVLFKLNNDSDHIGYVQYEGQNTEELGVFDLKGQKTIWTLKIDGDLTVFGQSRLGDRLYFRTNRHGKSDFFVLAARSGKIISHWAPFRWISWCLPVISLSFLGCCLAFLRPTAASKQLRWIAFLSLSVVYLVPLLTHLWYWKVYDRPMPVHHYIEGYFVGALVASAAWITWGSGRFVIRLIPLFAVVCLLLALSRLMLANIALTKEAVGSTLLASSFGFPMFFMLRLLGVRGPKSYKPTNATSPWTIPIRDLFLFSTGIAVLLAISIPLIKSIEMPSGFPTGTKQMIVGAVAMYIGLVWLMFCELSQRSQLAALSVIALAIAVVAGGTYEFATGQNLIFVQYSFEMAIFRVAATALITFYFSLQCIFAKLDS